MADTREARLGLKSEYIRIDCGSEWSSRSMGSCLSYGGNQGWFTDNCDGCISPMGCGLISCADILLYKSGRTQLTKVEYMDYVRSLNRGHLKVRRRLGVNGLSLAWGIRSQLRALGSPLRASWCFSKRKLLRRITAMIENDTPVTISVGPHLGKKRMGVDFFVRSADGSFVLPDWRSGLVRDHYVTVTAVITRSDGTWLEISSWGERYYIDLSQYSAYQKNPRTFFSNIMYLR